MGNRSELVVGLDIGTTKICAVVGEMTSNGINIVGIGTSISTGLRKGVVINIEQTVQSIKKALEEAELMAGCEIRSVYAGIAGGHIKGFNSHGVIAIKGGEVGERDIERVIEAAKAIALPLDREVIHILPQEYIIDDQGGIIEPLGMAGVRLEVKVHVVTGAVTSAQNIVRSCHRTGLDVDDIVLEALASAKSVLTEEEKEIGVCIIDIGGGTSDVLIFQNNSIKYTGVLPLGGIVLTSDISYGLRTPILSAEKIKIEHGCALSDLVFDDEIIEVPSVGGREPRKLTRRALAEICEPRMEEMLALISEEINKSGFRDSISSGVVLTGGGSQIEGLVELAEQIFDMPVRIGTPIGVGGLTDIANTANHATAVGLLIYGAEQQHNSDNVKMRIREPNVFGRVWETMKRWFIEVK